MVAWWWVLIAFIAGEILGIGAIAICSANEPKEPEHKYIKR